MAIPIASNHVEQAQLTLDDERIRFLFNQDRQLGKLITQLGSLTVTYRTDYFASLVHSIVAQLISREAAEAILGRIILLTGGITPKNILASPFEELKATGLSQRKTEYIRVLAEKVQTNQLDFNKLMTLTNAEVHQQLTSLKGIGPWTADVFLILSLKRENVLAIGDVALQRAASWLYGKPAKIRKETLQKKAKDWQPYQSLACLYLWEIIHLKLIESYPTAEDFFQV